MQYFVHTCTCGRKTRVSEYQLGMETACPNCKADITFTEANCQPLDPEPGAAPESPTAAGATAGAEYAGDEGENRDETPEDHCDRCGRQFRGDWDRHDTVMGELCNICANLVDSKAAETPKQATTAGPAPSILGDESGVEDELFRPRGRVDGEDGAISSASQPWFMQKYPKESRILLWSLAILMIVLAIVFSFVEEPVAPPAEDAERQETAVQQQAEGELSPVPVYLAIPVSYLLRLVAIGLPIFMALLIGDKLPYESWSANMLDVGLVSLGIALLGIMPFGGLIVLVVTVWLLLSRYDCGFVDIITWLIMGIPAAVLVYALEAIVMGLIGNAFYG